LRRKGIPAGAHSAIGGIELLDIITLSSDVQDVTFGAGGDGVHGTALDGDVDDTYILVSRFPPEFSDSEYYFEMRPNGISTNQASRNLNATGTGYAQLGQPASMRLLEVAGAHIRTAQSRAEISAKTGSMRTMRTRSSFLRNFGGLTMFFSNDGWWTDTTTNITSLVIHSHGIGGSLGGEGAAGDFIKSGSEFKLYRRGVWL